MSDTDNLTIHYRKLRGAKGYHSLTYKQIAERAQVSEQSISDVLQGCGTTKLHTITAVAGALGMRVIVDFVPVEPEAEK